MDIGTKLLAAFGGGLLPSVIFLAAGLTVLIKGSDMFVTHASAIATRLGIPAIVIGLTIVAMGTSAPEAAVSITAAAKGSAGIAVGNVFGSNILNVLIILGLCALRKQLPIQRDTIRYEMPFLVAVSVFMTLYGHAVGYYHRLFGVICLLLFCGYLGYLALQVKRAKAAEPSAEAVAEDTPKPTALWLSAAFIVAGIIAVILGSDVAVAGAVSIAQTAGISDRIIGLTIIALGTSLPELVTSIMAVGKGKTDIAVGNIVGSNLFNIMFVMGVTSVVSKEPLMWLPDMLTDGIAAAAAAVILLCCAFTERKVARWEGGVFIAAYAVYLTKILVF